MSNPTKLQRHLDLIAYLVGRRLPVEVDELMERIPAYAKKWGSGADKDRLAARRMFERDKDELRTAGIPIRTLPFTMNYGVEQREGYVIDRRDFYLPYLKLVQGSPGEESFRERGRAGQFEIREEDATLALEALRRVADVPSFPLIAEARSAFRKLAFDLDPQAFAGDSHVLFLERPGSAELTGVLRVLSDALLARKRVHFRYHGIQRGQLTEREVAPYGLLFQHGHWYLIGYDPSRQDTRIFKVGRMDEVQQNAQAPNTADFQIPDDFKLDDYVGKQAWELGDEEPPIRARVHFRFPHSLWAERNALGQLDEWFEDGSSVRSFAVQQVHPFLRWVLSLQTDAVIIDPPELASELKKMAAAVAVKHGAGNA
jgi:predicted DNA-binding transcriptional regulator YafY